MPLFRESIAHGFRFFRRDASVAIPAAGILALGLGANIAIFAVAYAVLLRPLPVANQQSLVIMWERAEERAVSVWEVSHRDFKDWESQNASFVQLAATGSINWSERLMQNEGRSSFPLQASREISLIYWAQGRRWAVGSHELTILAPARAGLLSGHSHG